MQRDADIDAINDLLGSYVQTWRSNDMVAWGALFTDDADFVTHTGEWWRSKEQNIARHAAVSPFIQQQKSRYVLEVLSVRLLTVDTALVHASWFWPQFARSSDEPPADVGGLLTMVLVRHGHRWLIRASQNTKDQGSRSGKTP